MLLLLGCEESIETFDAPEEDKMSMLSEAMLGRITFLEFHRGDKASP